jgi:hypothetical protein
MKWDSKQPNKAFQGARKKNPNQFRRMNDDPQIMQRERRNYFVTSDVISLLDEKPTITMGPHIEDGSDASPPFYISLNFHENIQHKFLMDLGASYNVMPKIVMEEVGLEITKPCL